MFEIRGAHFDGRVHRVWNPASAYFSQIANGSIDDTHGNTAECMDLVHMHPVDAQNK